jgi:transposase-like protein
MQDNAETISTTASILAVVRDARFSQGRQCPRCGSLRAHRWGRFSGRQRYRCCGCGRTFSDLTGTPAAYIKKLHLWNAYATCLQLSMSVRRSAAMLEINPTTSFRWRHRLLIRLASRPETLIGWIEFGTMRLPYSEKGRRPHDGRSAGRSDAAPGGRERPPVSVVLAHDRMANLFAAVCSMRPSAQELEKAFRGHVTGRLHVCANEGHYGPFSRFARSLRGTYRDARGARRPGTSRPDPLDHITNARQALVDLRDWMRRFHGVATKYLLNYLNWFIVLSRVVRRGLCAEILRWPFADAFRQARSAPSRNRKR